MTIAKIKREIEKEINKEMEMMGFINDSDNCDRFIDQTVYKYIELLDTEYTDDERDSLVEEMRQYSNFKYNSIGEVAKNGNLTLFYTIKKYETLQEFAEENGIVGICGII